MGMGFLMLGRRDAEGVLTPMDRMDGILGFMAWIKGMDGDGVLMRGRKGAEGFRLAPE